MEYKIKGTNALFVSTKWYYTIDFTITSSWNRDILAGKQTQKGTLLFLAQPSKVSLDLIADESPYSFLHLFLKAEVIFPLPYYIFLSWKPTFGYVDEMQAECSLHQLFFPVIFFLLQFHSKVNDLTRIRHKSNMQNLKWNRDMSTFCISRESLGYDLHKYVCTFLWKLILARRSPRSDIEIFSSY